MLTSIKYISLQITRYINKMHRCNCAPAFTWPAERYLSWYQYSVSLRQAQYAYAHLFVSLKEQAHLSLTTSYIYKQSVLYKFSSLVKKKNSVSI